ncbi:MAG: cellulase family glycosylhydrolase [Ignavibacteriales bacterium]|nr:cellulase family glycosylhydrolase [Ignavibacteriales bacterium]
MKKILALSFIVFLFIMSGCSGVVVNESTGFINVNDTHFILNGKPYFFVGTNLWYGCYLGSPGKTGNRERLIRELNNLQSTGIMNLRVCAASEESLMGRSIKPAIQISPNNYDEELLEGLDFLLFEMHKRDMKAVLFLNNYWQWTGGMAQYNAWFGDGKVPDPDDPNVGYGKFMDYSAEFYLNDKAKECFRNYLRMIITRVNKFNGIAYRDNPTIMAWQLANEPRPGRDLSIIKSAEIYYKWIDETAQYIHSLDPNHLVTTGNEGLAGSLQSEEIFLKSHESKYIDYATMHIWPKNWGWFDASNIDETYPSTEKNAIEYINKHLKYARQLNKPITMEEFGIPRDYEASKPGTPTTARDKYYKNVFAVIYDSAAAGAPIAGTNFWGWGGVGRGRNLDDKWREGDPYTGDPPQESQGLNSIYDTDLSTLEIISTHAAQMEKLRNKIQMAKIQ